MFRSRHVIRTETGPAGQFQDAHGTVTYALALPNRRQRRSRVGLARDFQACRPRACIARAATPD